MKKFPEPFTEQRRAHGLRLWLANGFDFPANHEKILLALDKPDSSAVEILKSSNRRSVLRVKSFSTGIQSIIIKGFPLKKIDSKFKHKKYGRAEFQNYNEAAARKIPAPKCYGCFEVRSFGLVKANGVLIENLQNFASLDQLAKKNHGRRSSVLSRSVPLLKLLFETGVNHIDSSPQNMLLSPDGADLRLIDWQYCSFVAPRQTAQLLLQAAHFLNYAQLKSDSPDGFQWLNDLHAACDCGLPIEKFRAAVASLQSRKKISGTDRLALTLDPQTEALLK